jgi:D-lactate dehydrogenase
MKVFAYSIKKFEQNLLETANAGKHQLTFSYAALSAQTAYLSAGFDAIVVFTNDDLSAPIIEILASQHLKYIITRSVGTDHIDLVEAGKHGMKVLNVPAYSPQAIAEHAVALAMALSRQLIPTYDNCRKFDFRIDEHMGFNFYQKTVGLIGLGRIGLAAAKIFRGLGCQVLGYDIAPFQQEAIESLSLETLLERADIISLHVPLNKQTRHLINDHSIARMRTGVMLINTSRGGVVDTKAVIKALEGNKIGYLGMDVYEFEKGLFFEDHRSDIQKDRLLAHLMTFPNVLITPHQAFLTKEAVAEIASSVIVDLDNLQADLSADLSSTPLSVQQK